MTGIVGGYRPCCSQCVCVAPSTQLTATLDDYHFFHASPRILCYDQSLNTQDYCVFIWLY